MTRENTRFARSILVPVTIASLLSVGAFGCAKTIDDVEMWKGTMKGPQKMLAVLENTEKYDLVLRTRAGLALIEMNRPEIDLRNGDVAEPIDVLEARLQETPEADRIALLEKMTPELIKLMNTASPEGPDPSNLQVRAKDAVFRIMPLATGEVKKSLASGLMSWYATDFSGRSLSGTASAEQIVDGVVSEMGASALSHLEGALSAKMPHTALAKLAHLLANKASPKIRGDAAKHLVKIYDEVVSAKHVKWWEEEVKRQFADAGRKIETKQLMRTALHNREIQVTAGVLTAMKHFASDSAVADRLMKIATTETDGSAIEAERRRASLAALEGKVTAKHLNTLMNIALNEKNPPAVQDYAFDRVSDIGSKAAIPRLWPLVENGEQRKRWRAGELILQIGGPSVVGTFFDKLPGGKEVKYEPEELEGYAIRMTEMKKSPSKTIRRRLNSARWWDRIIALKFLERTATTKTLPLIKGLMKNKDAVVGKGWKGHNVKTVGEVAEKSYKAAEARLKATPG